MSIREQLRVGTASALDVNNVLPFLSKVNEGARANDGQWRYVGPGKRVLDLALAVPLLIIVLPVFVIVAILVRADSRGPVFFRQTRLGKDGRPFRIFKFRSMHVMENGETIIQAQTNDARITRVGAWLRATSIDELPQLLNVIAGEMSLVGPRPHACAHDKYYATQIPEYTLRQASKPGITGWAQVHGWRGQTPTIEAMRKRVSFDLWYVRNAGLFTDLQILLRTPFEVLRSRNAR